MSVPGKMIASISQDEELIPRLEFQYSINADEINEYSN